MIRLKFQIPSWLLKGKSLEMRKIACPASEGKVSQAQVRKEGEDQKEPSRKSTVYKTVLNPKWVVRNKKEQSLSRKFAVESTD